MAAPRSRFKVKRLTAQQGAKVIRAFYEAYGPEQMYKSYGWTSPDAAIHQGKTEKMWAFYNGRDLVGWGSCFFNTQDVHDDEAVLSVGVFPEHQRQGYHVAILDWMCEYAKEKGASRATQGVFHSNDAHYARTLKSALSGKSGWIHAGEYWYPKGFGVFIRPLEENGSPASLPAPPDVTDGSSLASPVAVEASGT